MTKTCTQCGELKELSEYNKSGSNSLRANCKACDRANYYKGRPPKEKVCGADECDNIVHAKNRCVKCYNREYLTRRVAAKEARSAKGTPTWLEQPFEEWRRWRFAKPFIDVEDEIGVKTLWGAMIKMCQGGVEPHMAAKVIVLRHMDKAA